MEPGQTDRQTDDSTTSSRGGDGEGKSLRGLAPEGAARRPALGEGAPGRLPPEGLFPPELHTVLPLALGDLALILLLKREGKDKSSKTNQDGLTGLTDKENGGGWHGRSMAG